MDTTLPSSVLPSTAPSPDNLKDKILATLGGDDPVIMAFSNLSLDDITADITRLVRNAVMDKSVDVRKHALQQINFTIQEINVNPVRVKMMLEILASAVLDNVLSGREVCECLKELLNTDIENLSMELLDFFDVLVGCTDHKICQEIFTNCLQETSKLPSVLNGSHHRISNKINSLLGKLLDRKNLVLPPICSYCDIMIAFNKPNVYPHWTVSELLNNYVATFNCLTDLMTIENTEYFRPVVRHSLYTASSWKLDQQSLTFYTVNPSVFVLRFSGAYSRPQEELMLYTLKQTFCRDLVFNTMLGLRQGKQMICPHLEKVFMKLLRDTCHDADKKDNPLARMKVWERIGGELSSLIFANALNIKNITETLFSEIKQPSSFMLFHRNRHYIMWTLARCLSFGLKIIKLPRKDFLFVGDMIKLLYPEQSPLALPDINSPLSLVILSAASLWALFSTRSHDNPGLQASTPIALVDHLKFLQSPHHNFTTSDYSVCIILNFVNNFINNFMNTEGYTRPLQFLMESIYLNNTNTSYMLPGNVPVVAAIQPIPLELLDALSAHAKMNYMLTISSYITKMADPRDNTFGPSSPLSPALIETYSRLLIYSEIDFLSVKMMLNLSLTVFNHHAVSILSSLMEMFSYRMQFMKQSHHRVQMLTNLQQLAVFSQNKASLQPQLLYLAESFTIKLFHLFNYHDHYTIISRLCNPIQSNVKILSTTCEELNKVFILTVARTRVVSGNKLLHNQWLKPFMENMIASTPAVRDWSPYTINHFPVCLIGYCNQDTAVPEIDVLQQVGMEINRMQQASVKTDMAKYFRENDRFNIFLSIMLRKSVESDVLPAYACNVTSSWHPATLKQQIRNMVDFIVLEAKSSSSNSIFTKITHTLDEFIFRYKIFPIDTLILITALRKYSEPDSNISFFLIYNLLVKKSNLHERVVYFLAHAWPNFWQQSGDNCWTNVHSMYHIQYPEHQYFMKNDFHANTSVYLPVYYSNICLRFIPVLDIVIHRLIELPAKNSKGWLIDILTSYSGLFAYHDTPITFLHDTLYYYDLTLISERDLEKRVLVRAVLESQHTKPLAFLSGQFINYLKSDENICKWEPPIGYYLEMLLKMNDTIKNTSMMELSHIDWRFNEFGNPVCFILYLISVELLCVPIPYALSSTNRPYIEILNEHRLSMGTKLVDIVIGSKYMLPELSNTLALLFSTLPASFSQAVFVKISEIIKDKNNFYDVEISDVQAPDVHWNYKAQNVLILVHSFFQHCKADKIGSLPEFLNSNMSYFTMESQVVYILKLVSPFICHMFQERSHSTLCTTLCALYQAIFNLLGESTVSNPDLFVDYMYYIKYIFVGDELKPIVEKHLSMIPADISSKLKFLVQGTDVPFTTSA